MPSRRFGGADLPWERGAGRSGPKNALLATMVPRSDRQQLHHKPPHSELLTDCSLLRLTTAAVPPRELPGTELLGERLKTWGVRPDDPSAGAVRRRLARIQLSIESQFWLLETAERIAEAEKAKAAWNPKAKASQDLRLCKIVTAAARLIKEVSEVFPPPWTEERARLGLLVSEMAAFMEATLVATMVVEKNASVSLASATVRTMKQNRAPKSPVYWELLQDLVWLASAKKRRISERSVRRYVTDQHVSRSPTRAYLRRNFKVIQEAARINPLEKPASLPQGSRAPREGTTEPPDGGAVREQRMAIEAFTSIVRRSKDTSDSRKILRLKNFASKAAKERS